MSDSLASAQSNGGKFTCVDCGARSPNTALDETSVSLTVKYGWRLRRRMTAEGKALVEPRCPACHARFKLQSHTHPREHVGGATR